MVRSFNSGGLLTFNRLEGAESYRVEWALTPSGSWASFTGSDSGLNDIAAGSTSMITCAVPVTASARFFRVVARMWPSPDLAVIPTGTNSGTDPDKGSYSLAVSSFYMDKYLVTKEKWDIVYNWALDNGYSFDNAGTSKGANHPVHSISWYDCLKWCNARSEKEGRPAVYRLNDGTIYRTGASATYYQQNVAGYRLPSEVEWEYAARGGFVGRRFPWGDIITHNEANFKSNYDYEDYDHSTKRSYHPTYKVGSEPYTNPVNAFGSNGYGLHDMIGNLSEWTANSGSGSSVSHGATRGGNWSRTANFARIADTWSINPDSQHNTRGFRTIVNR